MSSFMKIAAMFVLSTPMALAGCMGDVDDAELNEPAAQPLGGDVDFTYSKKGPVNPVNPGDYSKQGIAVPCLVPPINCPAYSAPVTPAPSYPAPHFGAPKHEAPVYKAPAYQLPTYQLPGELPSTLAPRYEAPTYPGPTYQAPVYEAPIYDAPSFPAPIFERASYQECRMLPPWQLTPCLQVQESQGGGAGGAAISPNELGQGLMP